MEEVVQWRQPATSLLAGHPREWCHIWDSVLVSAIVTSGTEHNCSQVRFGEWKSMLLSPYITSNSATMAILFMGHWKTDDTQWIIPTTWLLNSSFADVIFWWAFTWDTNIFTLFSHLHVLSTYFFSRYISHQIFSHSLPKSLIIWPNHWLQTMSQGTIAHLVIFPFKQILWSVCVAWCFAHCEDFPSLVS